MDFISHPIECRVCGKNAWKINAGIIRCSHPDEIGYTLEYHCKSVADKARELCQGLNLNCETTAYYAGLLHDVGKLNPWYQDFFHIAKRFVIFKLFLIENKPPRKMTKAPIHIQITRGL